MCEYCKENMEGQPIPGEGEIAIETVVDDVFIYDYCDCGRHTVKRINYCPMCGKKLGA